MQTASRQEVVSAYREYNRLHFQPGGFAAFAVGVRVYPDMPFEQRSQFAYLINDLALFFQGVFALHEAGTIEGETYHAYLNWVAAVMATPGGNAWWAELGRPLYPHRMVVAIDSRIAGGDLPTVTEIPLFRPDPGAA